MRLFYHASLTEGYLVGKDFFLAFSPERVDPGNPRYQTAQYPQGDRRRYPGLRELATALYSTM